MKKSFLKGLLSGVCGAVLLFTVLGAAYIYATGKTNIQQNQKAQAQESTNSGEVVPYDKIVSKLTALQSLVDTYYLNKVDTKEYEDGIYKGFISSLGDPYSTYYTKKEYDALQESSSGVYCGIGAYVSQDIKTGIITIVKPFKQGPAYKAGVLPGDILYKVEDKEVTGEDLTKVVSKMKGVKGTAAKITVMRKGNNKPIEFSIVRNEIQVPTIEYKMLNDKIGYIIISEFDEVTVPQFKDAVDNLEKQGMKGLVIDLRNNPGGLLDSVVKMLDRLLPKELIVYQIDKNGKKDAEYAKDDTKLNVPLSVLINGESASASEIFAGAVQDYKIGTLVGTTSFGKGIVQKVIPLRDGSAVKLTISKYYTPKGRNIHGKGITPDVKVELSEKAAKKAVIPESEDNQLQKAISVVKEKIK